MDTEQLDDAGIAFAQACQDAGLAGFTIRTMENGNVRVVGLSLPVSAVVDMLRTAADVYERNGDEESIN